MKIVYLLCILLCVLYLVKQLNTEHYVLSQMLVLQTIMCILEPLLYSFSCTNAAMRGNHCNEQLLTTEHTEILSQPVVPDWMEKSNDSSML